MKKKKIQHTYWKIIFFCINYFICSNQNFNHVPISRTPSAAAPGDDRITDEFIYVDRGLQSNAVKLESDFVFVWLNKPFIFAYGSWLFLIKIYERGDMFDFLHYHLWPYVKKGVMYSSMCRISWVVNCNQPIS